MEKEEINTANCDNSIAVGENNTVNGHHSILIGNDLITDEAYKLIIKISESESEIPDEFNIDIDETISEREHHLISSAIKAVLYLQDKPKYKVCSKDGYYYCENENGFCKNCGGEM